MKIRAGFYVTRYENTLFLSQITRETNGEYYGHDLEKLDNGKSEITLNWPVDEVDKIEYLEYGRTIESLKKKVPQYFI